MISLLLALLAAEPSRNTVSLQALPLLAGGVSVQAERSTQSLRWSFALGVGARAAAAQGSDFTALNLSLGIEGRRWWHVGPLSTSMAGAVGGPFAFLRTDLVYVHLARLNGETVGSAVHPGLSTGVGYRLLPVWRLEVTPSLGVAFDLTARRFTGSFGLTVGVVL